ncbi:hypothetical protein [Breoghania sp. JC706]|uniref:hypothetical protein n=1 Tax=Breoghania sp. JC706 TaxID=3117732 RepID=UPI00300B8E44
MEYLSIFFFSQWQFLTSLERFTHVEMFRAFGAVNVALLGFLPFMVAARLLSARGLLATLVALGLSMIAFGYMVGIYEYNMMPPNWFYRVRVLVEIGATAMILVLLAIGLFASAPKVERLSSGWQVVWSIVAWAILFFSPIITWVALVAGGRAVEYPTVPARAVSVGAATLLAVAIMLVLPAMVGFLLNRFPSIIARRTVLVVCAVPWVLQIPYWLREAGLWFKFFAWIR